ncbi:putative CBL-interacting protein kinase 3 [Blattamonas nauphoetae]|uniref:CBL-interacting protein kinase 3 n=1 Tax=Blattamonas nauphoetae TaxID=2049346 RepID=A0ABQ9XXF3_9EUKA|nr:putative CBL-interacting protein kinase 3 [Blattamonas nauphoetae]
MEDQEVINIYTENGPWVKAITDFSGDPSDPRCISFKKGDKFELVRRARGWYVVRYQGELKFVPESYMKDSTPPKPAVCGTGQWAEATFNYAGNPSDPFSFSFKRGDKFEIVSKSGDRWSVIHEGEEKVVPRNHMKISTPPSATSFPASGKISGTTEHLPPAPKVTAPNSHNGDVSRVNKIAIDKSDAWLLKTRQEAETINPRSSEKPSITPSDAHAGSAIPPSTGPIKSISTGGSLPKQSTLITKVTSSQPQATTSKLPPQSAAVGGVMPTPSPSLPKPTAGKPEKSDPPTQKFGGNGSNPKQTESSLAQHAFQVRTQRAMSMSQNSGVGVPEEYVLLRNISDGASGSVVEVEEKSTRLHFAVKMLKCTSDKDSHRITREIHRNELFTHPGIVSVKEVVEMVNMQAIVMELGKMSLAQFVADYDQRGVRIPRHLVYRFMVDLSAALSFMHNHPKEPTAHADVKMENILLFEGNHVKLCDLGAAESEQTTATCSWGTQQYLSPERIEDDAGRASPASDVWALGIVLHRLLFGEPLFKATNPARLINEILSFKPSTIGHTCGEEERQLLMRMLDPDPLTRVTSKQLSESKMLRCLINTKDELWIINEQADKENQEKLAKQAQRIKELEAQLKIKC